MEEPCPHSVRAIDWAGKDAAEAAASSKGTVLVETRCVLCGGSPMEIPVSNDGGALAAGNMDIGTAVKNGTAAASALEDFQRRANRKAKR